MASSSLPSRRAPATAGANCRDCFLAALYAIKRSIITPIDQADMMNRQTTTSLAGMPIWFQRERGSHPTWAASCNKRNAHTCICKSIVCFLLRVNYLSYFSFPLLVQSEVHVDCRDHIHRLAVQHRGPV